MTSYLERLLTCCLAGPLAPREIIHVEVSHQEQCALLREGPCDCVPDITVHGSDQVFEIGPTGHVIETHRTQ